VYDFTRAIARGGLKVPMPRAKFLGGRENEKLGFLYIRNLINVKSKY
jgi:hypothetical protein